MCSYHYSWQANVIPCYQANICKLFLWMKKMTVNQTWIRQIRNSFSVINLLLERMGRQQDQNNSDMNPLFKEHFNFRPTSWLLRKLSFILLLGCHAQQSCLQTTSHILTSLHYFILCTMTALANLASSNDLLSSVSSRFGKVVIKTNGMLAYCGCALDRVKDYRNSMK